MTLEKKTEFRRNNVKTVYNGTKTLTFLGPRINGIQKTLPADFAKGCFFMTLFFIFCFLCLLTFYEAYFMTFASHFDFVFKSIYNQ